MKRFLIIVSMLLVVAMTPVSAFSAGNHTNPAETVFSLRESTAVGDEDAYSAQAGWEVIPLTGENGDTILIVEPDGDGTMDSDPDDTWMTDPDIDEDDTEGWYSPDESQDDTESWYSPDESQDDTESWYSPDENQDDTESWYSPDENDDDVTILDPGWTDENEDPSTPSGGGQTEQDCPFEDVNPSDYFYDAVIWAVNHDVIDETENHRFEPYNPCSRAQVLTFMWRACGSPEPYSNHTFVDVPSNAFYYKAVQWAVEQGITYGTTDKTFSPNRQVTRAQAVTFLYRMSHSTRIAGNYNPFTDVSAQKYYHESVLWAVENNITKGTTNTTFSPDKTCNRATIITFLYRYFNE